MLRYNRKNARNQGVAASCFRPAALVSAPRLPSLHPIVSNNITVNANLHQPKGPETKEGKVKLNDENIHMELDDFKHEQKEPQSLKSSNESDGVSTHDNANEKPAVKDDDEVEIVSFMKQTLLHNDSIHCRSKETEALVDRGSAAELNSLLSPLASSSPLALDDRSIANIECLGLRLVHLLSNLSSVESLFHGVVGCQILQCVKSNVKNLITECLQRLVSGIDGGFRRWRELLAATAKSVVSSGFAAAAATPESGGGESGGQSLEGELTSKSRGSRHVFMIRHGHYFSKERSDQQKRLTRLGREQLVLTGRRLREVGFEYDAIVSSTMTRAKESASIIVEQLKDSPPEEESPNDSSLSISVDQLLEEGAPLPPEPPMDFWQPNAAQFRADGPRIERAFQKYFATPEEAQEKDSHEIIVCHANVIRYCVCRALQVPPQAWLRMWLNHGSITWLTIRPEGRIVLRALGASGYMPPEKLTAN